MNSEKQSEPLEKKYVVLRKGIAAMLSAAVLLLLGACAPSGESEAETAVRQEPAASVQEAEETENAAGKDGAVKNPVVTITMEDGGVIRAELYPEVAPNTVRNFISLAKQGYYDGTTFHRVISGFMIQGGSPDGTGSGGPGYFIAGEFTGNGFQNDLKHTRGVLSMARASDPDSAGSQFFIMHGDAEWLDGQYAAFGMVTEGMDVVDRIASAETDSNDRPVEAQTVKSVTVETFGVTWPEPEVIK